MEFVCSILLSGISVGGQYALIAIGYTMVYGILRLINFAHGDMFMVAGLMMVYLSPARCRSFSRFRSMMVLTWLLGFVVERAAYKPLRTAPRMSVMISAIGVSYLLQNLALYITGGLAKQYPTMPGSPIPSPCWGATTKRVTVHHADPHAGAGGGAGAAYQPRPRSAWPCARSPGILRRRSSWASRSTASSPSPS
jgi:branched-chain amino acid transport system permease protein